MALQFSILSEKLAVADYESTFIGKGHLGYWTTDNLPINRGFDRHIGYLGGGESYAFVFLSAVRMSIASRAVM